MGLVFYFCKYKPNKSKAEKDWDFSHVYLSRGGQDFSDNNDELRRHDRVSKVYGDVNDQSPLEIICSSSDDRFTDYDDSSCHNSATNTSARHSRDHTESSTEHIVNPISMTRQAQRDRRSSSNGSLLSDSAISSSTVSDNTYIIHESVLRRSNVISLSLVVPSTTI